MECKTARGRAAARPVLCIIALCCLAAATAAADETAAVSAAGRKREYAKKTVARFGGVYKEVEKTLASHHISHKEADDVLSRRAWTNALETCDPSHMIFLERDVKALEKLADKLDDMARDGDISFPFLARRVFGARFAERVAFATNHLARVAKEGLSAYGEYCLDRSGMPWPATKEERDALWRACAESDVVNRLLDAGAGDEPTREQLEEACKKSAESYRRLYKMANSKTYDDVCEDYLEDFAGAYDAHTKYLAPSQFEKFRGEMLSGPKVSAEDDISKKPLARRAFSKTLDVEGRKLGYLRLSAFYGSMPGKDGSSGHSSAEDLAAELDSLEKAGAEGVLFDLRGNAGGGLDDAVKTLTCFIRSGPAVRMVGVGGDLTLPVAEDAVHWTKPLVVLIDRGSASAGELVPATLQDTRRAVIVGDIHSFGKGTAQSMLPLDGGKDGALAVTEGRFYRVTGASTQFRGVEPDIVLRSMCRNYAYAGERGMPYPLEWDERDAVQFEKSWDVDGFLPALRKASEKRRAECAAWKEYANMAARSEGYFNSRGASPLDIGARRAMRADRKRIMKRLDDLEAQREDKGKVTFGDGADPVRDESLRILGDLVELNGGRTLPALKRGAAQPGTSDALDDF